MNFKLLLKYTIPFIFITAVICLAACDEKARNIPTPPPPPQEPNPYGDGNGKITLIRKEQIDGPVTITLSGNTRNDTMVWQSTPGCDTNIAASFIVHAGNYLVRITGSEFLCSYNVTVEERVCKIQEYTSCIGGFVGCDDITGIWLRTADGPCPNCMGLKVEFRSGLGEVIYTPPGCRFPLGDIKWRDFSLEGCTILDLARDQYGGGPEYQNAYLDFINRNSFVINGQTGQIPYSRIASANDKKSTENTDHFLFSPLPVDTNGLQIAR